MAKKNPSTRWFFKDWHEDEGVQLCSLAARGLWIELLVLCAANEGYLLVGDRIPPSVAAMARYVGATPVIVRRLLKELEDHGVFSRDERGVIYCRRMVRENGGNRDQKTPKGLNREHDPNQADLFEIEPDSRVGAHPRDKASKAFQEQETDLINSDRDSERPAGALGDIGVVANPGAPPIMETPARMGPAGAPTGDADASTSSSSATDCKPIPGEAATLWKGAAPFLPANQRDLDLEGQDNDNPRQEPAMSAHGFSPGLAPSRTILGGAPVLGREQPNCRPAPRADRPRPRTKTPALRSKIKDQLQAKHGRFLVACRPQREVEAYWAAQLGDDLVEAQRVFDATDRRMRAMRWDDTREIAA